MLEWLLGRSPDKERPVTAKREKLLKVGIDCGKGLEQAPQQLLYLESVLPAA